MSAKTTAPFSLAEARAIRDAARTRREEAARAARRFLDGRRPVKAATTTATMPLISLLLDTTRN
jgi:hypothetical protein